jgi:GTP cyclohydrolase I
MPIDLARAEAAVRDLLVAIGENIEREGLRDTPNRVARAWCELVAGADVDPASVLSTSFEANGYDEMVVLRGIDFHSLCEHHLLPFVGTATIAYVPGMANEGGRVVGLSKLARLVDVFARRLQIQERMTVDIASALERSLRPLGAAVVIQARHLCMCARGVGKQNATMVTSRLTGVFKSDTAARAELFKLSTL